MLELTYRCNLNCAFCYLHAAGRLNGKCRELGTGEVLKIAGRFKAGERFYLSGGEPLLRGDLFEIMAGIRKSGCGFGLNTNGTLLNAAKAGKLAALKPDYVVFSLHGSEPVHDRLTGKEGAWRALTENMRRFASKALFPTEVIVNCVVHRENAGELLEVYRAACRAGAHRVVFEHLQFLRHGEAAGVPDRLKEGGIITPQPERYGADAALIARQF